MKGTHIPMPRDPQQLRSQHLRAVNYQGDALRLGMNWTEEDLAKPQVLVDSAYGMGHPGTFHFRELIEEVSNGVYEAGRNHNERLHEDVVERILADRRRHWTPSEPRHSKGILSLYARVARGASDGASIT
jgi:dihydroxyacid dehydratase/phosphogluconate dehydratase